MGHTSEAPRERRASSGAVPFIALDDGGEDPLYEQIYAALRDHVLRGSLPAGSRLASTRHLAASLGVSRFTVVTAYDALIAEGYLSGSSRSGTFVSRTLPEASIVARGSRRTAIGAPRPIGTGRLSHRGERIAQVRITGPRDSRGAPRPFHPRRAPLDVFPVADWLALVRRQWREHRRRLLDYGDPAGWPGLRRAIAHHAARTRGLECSPDQVIITAGAQQAFNLVFQLLLDPGDRAWIEEPGYLDARAALLACGAAPVPVPVDDQGIIVSRGVAEAPDARLAYVSPSHQYPTGATLSAARRLELLAWAHRTGAWIVEDDYDSYFRYTGRPLPALQRVEADLLREPTADARHGTRVIYIGTFAKTMFPSLRLGYCVVPAALGEAFASARAVADRNSSLVDQAALESFIAEGHYDRHLRRVRAACIERHEAMLEASERHLGNRVTMAPMGAGTHVLGRLAPGLPTAISLESAARDAGLVLFPLSRYCIRRPARDALVLGFGGPTPRAIDAGARRLARLLDDLS
jgi:GntR family transcriptional regulator/MocR family aminotransferase